MGGGGRSHPTRRGSGGNPPDQAPEGPADRQNQETPRAAKEKQAKTMTKQRKNKEKQETPRKNKPNHDTQANITTTGGREEPPLPTRIRRESSRPGSGGPRGSPKSRNTESSQRKTSKNNDKTKKKQGKGRNTEQTQAACSAAWCLFTTLGRVPV